MSAYWLGLATIPAVMAAGWLLITATFSTLAFLRSRFGVTFSANWSRGEGVSDYTLRHNIFWERSLGCFFVGGWYREEPWRAQKKFNRWVGVGHPDGPNVIAFRSVTYPQEAT